MTKKNSNRFSPEVRERAVRMVLEHGGDRASQWAAIGSIASKIGCTGETLRKWVRQAERDRRQRPGVTSDERERMKSTEREIRELRQANEILRKASAYFAQAELDRRSKPGSRSSTIHRALYGVEPICKVLPIAPSTYHARVTPRVDRGNASARAQRDVVLRARIRDPTVFEANFAVYGVRKTWRQLGREGTAAARSSVARLMRQIGLRGRRSWQRHQDDSSRQDDAVPG
jgi:transposase-like protein